MTTLAEYAAANTAAPKVQHPTGFEPGLRWDGRQGTLCSGPTTTEPDPAFWKMLMDDWGIDSTSTEVVDGSIQLRAWDANLGEGNVQRMFYYRATIKSRVAAADRADIDLLIKSISKKKPLFINDRTSVAFPGALVVLLSDWQIGKGEGGGTPATVERIKTSTMNLLCHVKYLQSMGRGPSAIYLVGLGDVVEGCSEFYAMQTFTIDLDRREQKKVVRRLLLWIVDTLLPLAIPLVVGAVPGNHGENRKDGKAYTTLTDNDDLAAFEELAEMLAMNPDRYANVHFPQGSIADDLTMTLDVSGVTCGFAHGHQMKGGAGGAQGKIEAWWKGQALGRQRVASAEILFTGHLHHFVCSEATGRTFFQCPAQDGGSQWFVGTSGASSNAGMLVVGVGTGYGPRGWGDMAIL